MKMVKAVGYNAHKDYDVTITKELLNMKIRIFGEDFDQTGKVLYEGTVGKFIKERLPSEQVVKKLTQLEDKISYKLNTEEIFIERIM